MKNKWSARSAAGALLELLYPSSIYCLACGNLIDDSRPYALCDVCVREIGWANGKTCAKCGKVLAESAESPLCSDCGGGVAAVSGGAPGGHIFDRGFSCAGYGEREKQIVHNFKYKDRAYYGAKLAEIMRDRIQGEDIGADLLVPVPMFRKKERKRGFNQAAVMAESLSRKTGIECRKNLLVRTRDTAPMSKLGAEARRSNVEGAFAVAEDMRIFVRERQVLLIDDVFTTGSTADACADALKKCGAESVCVLVFAAGADRTEANFGTGRVCG
ncbi:MAG: ComF family protein [Clostridiales Family XIII bacterium]|jgi:ComF family protein|nr:ComF family protein [Clostridiales Family XIII bacterium]